MYTLSDINALTNSDDGSIYSDMFKDIYGGRPRHAMFASVEEFDLALKSLSAEMEQKTVSEIMSEMEQDIRCDIYREIFGHESWAEEIFRLRTELHLIRKKAVEDSWARSPDRMGGQFTNHEINRGPYQQGEL